MNQTFDETAGGNRLIVEFMSKYSSNAIDIINFGKIKKGTTYKYYPEKLEFHLKWDILMSVVKQLEDKGYFVSITTNQCYINKQNDESRFVQHAGKNKLYNLFLCVVSIIKDHLNE